MFSRSLNYLIWAITAALYAPMFVQLYKGRWELIDYTHAYFILPVALFLAWRKRTQVIKMAATPTPSLRGGPPQAGRRSNLKQQSLSLILLILGLILFLFGWRQDYAFITALSLIPVLFGLTGFLYGPAAARALAFPILYLLLLVPPPLGILDAVTIPMRSTTTVLTAGLLQALHYPITRDGLLLSLGGHQIYMGPACSGFRSLITMISLGLAYAYIVPGTRRTKYILTASIVPLALLGNLVRVVSVCLVTYHFGETTGARYHDASGFIIFLILISGLMGIERLLNNKEALCA